jgi:S1-C subfamily serine protease
VSGRGAWRYAPAALAAAIVLAVAGCGGSSSNSSGSGSAGSGPPPEKTRVRVIEGLSNGGHFDPEAIYKELAPGVVTVVSQYNGGGLLGGSGAALGSGFVLDGKGYIATNAHVVLGDPPKLDQAKAVYIRFSDGNRVPAQIVGTDIFSDIALLKVDPTGLTLTPLKLGTTHGLAVGSPVVAIGSPFGEEQSLSVGVVSGLHRSIDSLTNFKIEDAIQTDAAINHGNSGGPLLDAGGKVVGINSQIQSTGGGGEGVGFAVSVDTAGRSLAQLRSKHSVAYAYLGVSSEDMFPQLAKRLGLPVGHGALVAKVEPGGPAKAAGISAGTAKITFQGASGVPSNGDVIVAINGHPVTQSSDVGDVILGYRPGQQVRIELVRGASRRTVTVTLGSRPRKPASSTTP